MEARLRFAPYMAYRVYDEFDQSCVARQEDGSLLVESVFPEDQWLYGYLLSFGAGVEVLSPDTLRCGNPPAPGQMPGDTTPVP